MKLIKKRPIGAKELDTVAFRKSGLVDDSKDPQLLGRAQLAWESLSEVREARARGMRFVYGDQWGDTITVESCGCKRTMTMREYLSMEGNIPLQTNQLHTQVNTIVGVLVKEQNEPVCNARDRDEQQYGELLTMALQANCNKNRQDGIYKLATKDLLIGGIACTKEFWGYRENDRRRQDTWTQYIDPNYLILETTFRDPRGWDMDMIGCWWRMSRQKLKAEFVHSREDLEKIERIYGPEVKVTEFGASNDILEQNDLDNLAFMRTNNPNEVCVAEVWTYETKERIRVHDWNEGTEEIVDADDKEMIREIEAINRERRELAKVSGFSDEEIPLIDMEYFVDAFWYCRIMAQDGTVLFEEESPYPDRMHPFTIVLTPFIDGRISGFISDGIEHQIALNRALVLQDWIVRNQVKGFTMIPKQFVPENMSNEQFIRNAITMGNYLFYDAEAAGKTGAQIQTVYPNAVSFDASNYINEIRSLMETSTAVNGAIQGKTPYSGTSASLYAQMTLNSSTPIASLLQDIRLFMEDVAIKKTKNIAAFYTPDRFATIAGGMAELFNNANLNLNEVGDIEFDVSIKESSETPVYRAVANDQLLQFFQMGAIDLPTMLEVGSFPYGDSLLQKIQARQAEMQAAQNGEMGEASRQTAQQMENPVESQAYGIQPEKTVKQPVQ